MGCRRRRLCGYVCIGGGKLCDWFGKHPGSAGVLRRYQPNETDGVISLILSQHFHLRHQEGAHPGCNLTLPRVQVDQIPLNGIPLLLGILQHALSAQFGFFYREFGLLLRVVLYLARRVASRFQRLLQRQFHLFIVGQLACQLLVTLLQPPVVLQQFGPLVGHLADESVHFIPVIPAESESPGKLVLTEFQGGKSHGCAVLKPENNRARKTNQAHPGIVGGLECRGDVTLGLGGC